MKCTSALYFYASAYRRRRHYVFGLSVRPSVRSPKYPLSTCTWVRWSIRPTVTVLWHVRPSVRPSVRPFVRRGFWAFAGERMEGMAWNFACWCIVTTFRTGKIMVTVCWFYSFWRHFDLVKGVKFGVSGHFLENTWREWAEILYADVSWPPSEQISLWLWSVAFSNFGTILT